MTSKNMLLVIVGVILLCFVSPFVSATFTLTSPGGGFAHLGDDVSFSGINDETSTVYLFLTGPNIPANGGQIASIDPKNFTVQDGKVQTFKAAPVSSNTWTWTWPTGLSHLDPGTYTIYALEAPRDQTNLGSTTYATYSVILTRDSGQGASLSTGTTQTYIAWPESTLFIGEDGLDITLVTSGNNSIAWWASASPGPGAVAPNKIIDVSARRTNFAVDPTDFVGYTGRPGNQ